ncbi:MAG: hypothetical protein MAG795_00152 [Candidatus Woesearchaeota archaeon]|nr:hypothetical protein [Candidatus Woesearchaeota archaeon]
MDFRLIIRVSDSHLVEVYVKTLKKLKITLLNGQSQVNCG